jgi:hypothetical protein
MVVSRGILLGGKKNTPKTHFGIENKGHIEHV